MSRYAEIEPLLCRTVMTHLLPECPVGTGNFKILPHKTILAQMHLESVKLSKYAKAIVKKF